MSKALTTDTLSIERATVELHVIRVSGKQMTLAVFKQLPQYFIGHLWRNQLDDADTARERAHIEQDAHVWGYVLLPRTANTITYHEHWWVMALDSRLWRVAEGLPGKMLHDTPQLFIAV